MAAMPVIREGLGVSAEQCLRKRRRGADRAVVSCSYILVAARGALKLETALRAELIIKYPGGSTGSGTLGGSS